MSFRQCATNFLLPEILTEAGAKKKPDENPSGFFLG
jgi:hypothetical protein